jgi:prepilin-type processing-associated H-X9-DG protein
MNMKKILNIKKYAMSFTLLELLIVIAIIMLLASILMPALSKAQGMARRTLCSGNLKQINTAYLSYAFDNNDITISAIYGGSCLRWESSLIECGYLPNNYYPQPLNGYGYHMTKIMLCPGLQNPITLAGAIGKRSDYGLNYVTCQRWDSVIWNYTSSRLKKISPRAVVFGDRYDFPKADQPAFGAPSLIYVYGTVYPLGMHHGGGSNLSFIDGHIGWIKKGAELTRPELWTTYN